MPPGIVSPMTLKRIHREIADLKKEDLGTITLAPAGDNLFLFKGTIPGPEGSVYEGGVYNLDVQLASDYPFSAPKVVFKTRIYHMNISEAGGICIDILKHNWSPALSLFKVMLSLSSLLTDPNPQDPLVPSIATQYVRNRVQHDSTARQWTQLYARPPPPPAPAVPSAKAKGKKKSAPDTRSVPDEITILDSDEEAESASKRGGRKRKRDARPAEIELVDSDEAEEPVHGPSEGSSSKRKRPRPSAQRSKGHGSGSGARQQVDSDDVIVIEDD